MAVRHFKSEEAECNIALISTTTRFGVRRLQTFISAAFQVRRAECNITLTKLAPQPDLESEGCKPSLARHFKSEEAECNIALISTDTRFGVRRLQTLISAAFQVRRGRVQHSAKMAAMDSTKAYIPLLPFFVRDRNRPLIT